MERKKVKIYFHNFSKQLIKMQKNNPSLKLIWYVVVVGRQCSKVQCTRRSHMRMVQVQPIHLKLGKISPQLTEK